eukprot:gene2708-biopygen7865
MGYTHPHEAVLYAVSQYVGCVLGAMYLSLMIPGVSVGGPGLGCFSPSEGITDRRVLAIEGLGTFVFTLCVFAVVWYTQNKHGYALAIGPLTGGAMNPARVLASPTVFNEGAGCKGEFLGVYVGAEMLGATLSAICVLLCFGVAEVPWYPYSVKKVIRRIVEAARHPPFVTYSLAHRISRSQRSNRHIGPVVIDLDLRLDSGCIGGGRASPDKSIVDIRSLAPQICKIYLQRIREFVDAPRIRFFVIQKVLDDLSALFSTHIPGLLSHIEDVVDEGSHRKEQLDDVRKSKTWCHAVHRAQRARVGLRLLTSGARADCYNEWVRVGWCLRNIDHRLLDKWEEFSQQSPKYVNTECARLWNKMRTGGLGIGTLHMWAKHDNPEAYLNLIRNDLHSLIMQSSNGTHYDVARVVHHMYRYDYVCASIKMRIWYEFRNHRWHETDSAYTLRGKISTQVLKKTAFKDNVMRECCELFHGPKKFCDLLDSNCSLVGFENGVYDLERFEFRDGRPDDYITFSTGCAYTPIPIATTPVVAEINSSSPQTAPTRGRAHVPSKDARDCLSGATSGTSA